MLFFTFLQFQTQQTADTQPLFLCFCGLPYKLLKVQIILETRNKIPEAGMKQK